jgi:hypothetical protein
MTVTLYNALDLFQDHLEDIENALRANLQADLTQERQDAKVLGSGYIADEVRKLRIENVAGTRPHMLKMIRSYLNAQLHPSTNRITDIDIARAREHAITELHAGKLTPGTTRRFGICPFHQEKSGSLCVYVKTNSYKCYGCQEQGDSIKYYMKTRGVQFKDAVRALARI